LESRTYYYARVSSTEQNLDRQIEAFRAMGAGEREIITDKASGKNLDRPGYKALREIILRRGDTLVIKSLDRLSRNKNDIKKELEYFRAERIRLKVLDLPTTLIELPMEQSWIVDMINNILIEVLSSIAEQERVTLLRRQREGIELAKKKGKYQGRKPVDYPEKWEEYYELWKNQKITAKKFMTDLNLKRTTFYKLVKKYEQKEQNKTNKNQYNLH